MGSAKLANGTDIQVPIDHQAVMNHQPREEFALNVTTSPKHANMTGLVFGSIPGEDDYWHDFKARDTDGITPLSQVNGTNVTIAELLVNQEKL